MINKEKGRKEIERECVILRFAVGERDLDRLDQAWLNIVKRRCGEIADESVS